MRITFELESADIEHFQGAFDRARRLACDADEVDIVDAAKQALDSLCIATIPGYVRKRLVHVQRLILMLEDEDWNLGGPERIDALAALAYFGDPDDLIPDHIEVIGLIDDAIMLELLARRMRHVLHAYRKFCALRNAMKPPADDVASRTARARLLAGHRASLMEELSSRRDRIDAHVDS
ncbi:MAG: DUF1232 domain-containing protein [Hyphomicrobiaceae bacterium]|nr:DUF1232 domain-containing protein [Dokdonella sp.]MCB1548107.1 DUF1232 domain-containing protein [Hyphomicrobiaceae bacterium]MCB1570695.1 DUF1232 domain-containing protein [Xanthomonadales bacterium]MCB1574327.1 DUF1232 domain-containing protein [Xanthomonadales bacterium]MCB1578236.1 DUF1232 domain-containing protein [Xanthomonadales bacterium]